MYTTGALVRLLHRLPSRLAAPPCGAPCRRCRLLACSRVPTRAQVPCCWSSCPVMPAQVAPQPLKKANSGRRTLGGAERHDPLALKGGALGANAHSAESGLSPADASTLLNDCSSYGKPLGGRDRLAAGLWSHREPAGQHASGFQLFGLHAAGGRRLGGADRFTGALGARARHAADLQSAGRLLRAADRAPPLLGRPPPPPPLTLPAHALLQVPTFHPTQGDAALGLDAALSQLAFQEAVEGEPAGEEQPAELPEWACA